MVFNISLRFFGIIPTRIFIITGTTLALFSFQDLFTSCLKSWYLAILLISASFRPKSPVLTPQLSMPSSLFLHPSMISARNALFSIYTPDRVIKSYGSRTSMFLVIAFGSFSHKFSGTGISVFADVPADYFTNSVVSLCVQLFWHVFFSCSAIKHHISFSLLTPPPPLTCLFFHPLPNPFLSLCPLLTPPYS